MEEYLKNLNLMSDLKWIVEVDVDKPSLQLSPSSHEECFYNAPDCKTLTSITLGLIIVTFQMSLKDSIPVCQNTCILKSEIR